MSLQALKTAASVGELSQSSRYVTHLQEVNSFANEDGNFESVEVSSSSGNLNKFLDEEDPEYQLILQSNGLLLEIDEEIFHTYIFVAELYRRKFPELEAILPNRLDYIKVVQRIENEMDLTVVDLSDLVPQSTVMVLAVSSSTTPGKPLDEISFRDCMTGCAEILRLYNDKTRILSFIQSRMVRLAPNLCALVGSQITAQLVGLAGGVAALAKIPACNIQVMGQPKRNLMGLSSQAFMPHAGVLSNCDIVKQTPPDFRRKALKALAGKVALAARIDSFQTTTDATEGHKLRNTFEVKLEKIQEPSTAPTKKALPIPEEKKKSRRGGKRVKKMKERLQMTDLRKQQNRMDMSMEGGEYGDSSMGVDQGTIGHKDTGKVRATKVADSSYLKRQKKVVAAASSGQTGGMSSSLVFTPVQGLELVNPQAAQEKVKEANKKWFDSYSGFLSAVPKN
jgi:U4/U6 small nuclear ribonucleoprotein PRP31